MTTDLVTVRCRGCRQPIAVSYKDAPAWCNTLCLDMPPAAAQEERDSLIELLAREKKLTPTQIAVRFEMKRQRVHQILEDRSVPRIYA